jgi:hypothetical protein
MNSNVAAHMSRIYTTALGNLKCDHFSHGGSQNESLNCFAIEEFIQLGRDSSWIKPGQTVGLTVVPYEAGTQTAVVIDSDEIAPEVFPMKVNHATELGSLTTLTLGVWMPGEGRRSIREVVWNAMTVCLDPRESTDRTKIFTRCPNPAHGLREQRLMESKIIPNSTYKSVCVFNMIFEKMCTECLSQLANDPDGLAGVNLNA